MEYSRVPTAVQADVRWVWSGALGDKSVKVLTDRALTGVLTGVPTGYSLGYSQENSQVYSVGYSRGYSLGGTHGGTHRVLTGVLRVVAWPACTVGRRTHGVLERYALPWDCAGVAADGGGLSRGVRRALRSTLLCELRSLRTPSGVL
jgi:hypothetical protein